MLFKQMINSLENARLPLSNCIITFFCATLLRNLLEAYSQTANHLNLPASNFAIELIHYTLSYLMIALIIIFIFYWASRTPIEKLLRLVSSGFLLLLITPLVDLMISGGKGIDIKYLLPENDHLWLSYLTYAGGKNGITVGIKVEVMVLLIGSYFYFRLKELSMLASLFFTWLLYTVIFCCAMLPIFIRWIEDSLHSFQPISGTTMIHAYLLIVPLLAIGLFYLGNKPLCFNIMKALSCRALCFFELALLAGIGIAVKEDNHNAASLIDTLLAMLSILFALNFKSLLTEKLVHARAAAYLFLFFSLFYAAMINTRAFLILACLSAIFFLQSALPIKLNRFPFANILGPMFSAYTIMVLGFSFVKESVEHFPNGFSILLLLILCLILNFPEIIQNTYHLIDKCKQNKK